MPPFVHALAHTVLDSLPVLGAKAEGEGGRGIHRISHTEEIYISEETQLGRMYNRSARQSGELLW